MLQLEAASIFFMEEGNDRVAMETYEAVLCLELLQDNIPPIMHSANYIS